MARRVQMSVDPDFKSFVRSKKKEFPGMSDREITKELANELTGKSLFNQDKKKGGKRNVTFNL